RPLSPTLFPYTTLFRSLVQPGGQAGIRLGRDERDRLRDADEGTQVALLSGDQALDLPQAVPGHLGLVWEQALHRSELQGRGGQRSEEHTSELQSRGHLV